MPRVISNFVKEFRCGNVRFFFDKNLYHITIILSPYVQTNSIIGLFRAKRHSSYFLEGIWDGFFSFPRIRLGGGPGGGPGGSTRLLFDPETGTGSLETPDCFLGIRNFFFFADFGFGLLFRFRFNFGLGLFFCFRFGMTISSSLMYSSDSSSESWSIKCSRSGSLWLSHFFKGRTFCISKSFFPYN